MSDPDERRDDEPFGLMPGVNENSTSSYRLPSDVELERSGGWSANSVEPGHTTCVIGSC